MSKNGVSRIFTIQPMSRKIKVAAMADLHVRADSSGMYVKVFEEASNEADILVLCGDLTDLGLDSEAKVLARELKSCRIPVVGVLGNHDFESDLQDTVSEILSESMHVLNKEPVEISGIGFAGVKGYGGGFENRMLAAFGEKGVKNFVEEVLDEARKLENSLRMVNTLKKVILLHYSPIKSTLEGEALEIYPFLGSTRLEDTIDHIGAEAVFHGHAHHGFLSGKTKSGIPVYNCAIPVVEKFNQGRSYLVVEI